VSTASQLQTILIYPPLPGDLLILQKRKGKFWRPEMTMDSTRFLQWYQQEILLSSRLSYLTSQSRAQSSFFNGTEKR
jgi:hypothetical protein